MAAWPAMLAALVLMPALPALAQVPPPDGPAGAPGFRRNQLLGPVAPSSPTKSVLGLSAQFGDKLPIINSGLHWRIFSDQADLNGNYALVMESTEAHPLLTLDPGGYVVHVTYGLATATRHVVIGTSAVSERIVLDTGALRLTGLLGKKPIPPRELSFELHRTDDSAGNLVTDRIKAGEIVRLPAGSYQLISSYGHANARVITELRVEAGKLTDASVLHTGAHVSFLLTPARPGARDTFWSIQTPGGDVVVENTEERPTFILAEGDYVAVARRSGKIFQKPFSVETGKDERVEIAAK